MEYLDKINSPADMKKLSVGELKILSNEIREFLINSVAETGGHLASNLGVVDITIALHYCFDSPRDKFIWDVGHQAYTHKILTGRKDMFSTLRKFGGLSGFPKTEESRYDVFDAGHSSTSISAALGIAAARDLKGDKYNVVAFLGDGSMTGGLVFEALNNLGRSHSKLLVILNDNQMSISENVGAMSKYLSDLRSEPKYNEIKSDVSKLLSNMPAIGKKVNTVLERTKDGIKYALVPNSMFEQMGIKYIGPVDGHNISELVRILNKIKNIQRPVILHIITKKGKGYKFAEKYPSKFHGIASFDVNTGEVKSKKKSDTYSDVFGKTVVKLANKEKRLVVVTAAMPIGCGLDYFSKIYPKRIFDVGIAEEHAVTFSGGLAINGCIPIFAVYSTFLQRSYDQIVHDVCLQNLHVVFAIDRAGIVGSDGETHQGIYDLSFLSHIPNMTVMAPKNKHEFSDMLEYAVMKHRGPIAVRYPRGNVYAGLEEYDQMIELGKAEVIKEGKDIAIVFVGAMAQTAENVCKSLEEKGYEPALINGRFIKPVDEDMVRSFKNYRHIFTIEDNIISGGFGSMVLEKAAELGVCLCSIHNIGFDDCFVEQGSREQLFEKYGLDANGIEKRILKIIENEKKN